MDALSLPKPPEVLMPPTVHLSEEPNTAPWERGETMRSSIDGDARLLISSRFARLGKVDAELWRPDDPGRRVSRLVCVTLRKLFWLCGVGELRPTVSRRNSSTEICSSGVARGLLSSIASDVTVTPEDSTCILELDAETGRVDVISSSLEFSDDFLAISNST